MANGRNGNGGYKPIRQALAGLLLSVAALMVTADSLGVGRRVDPVVLIIVGSFGLTLLGIDAPDLIRDVLGRRKDDS
jgi:hypothetical protein